MTPSKACADLVKSFEGCILKAYPDPATGGDPWTIGVGHTGPEVKPGVIWTQAQADAALEADLARFARGVWNATGEKETTQNRFDSLVSFSFNVGLGNLLNSTLLRLHNKGDYAGAAEQFLRWDKANGKRMAGLTRRRQAERSLYLGLGK